MSIGNKYDVEYFLNDIERVFKANLNDQIDLVNDEKNNRTDTTDDDFTIARIPDDGWYLNHIPEVWSYKQFILWGLEDLQIKRPQPDGAFLEVKAFIEVAIPDDGEESKKSMFYKQLRYSRSLQDVALKNFDKIRGYGKIQVDALSPTLVSISDKRLRVSGITITALIGIR